MYYKLRDSGTSFYDPAQQLGIVTTRIGNLKATNLVANALKRGQLVLIEDQEQAAKDFEAQQAELDIIEGTSKAIIAARDAKAAELTKVVDETTEKTEEKTTDADNSSETFTEKSKGKK